MEADAYRYGFAIIELDSTDYFLIDKLPMQDPNVELSLALHDNDPEAEEEWR